MYIQQIRAIIENLQKTLEMGEKDLAKLVSQATPATNKEGAEARTEAAAVLIKQSSDLTALFCQQMMQANLTILELFSIESIIALTLPPGNTTHVVNSDPPPH